MMGYAKIIQAVGHWPTEPTPRVTIGQPCVQMSSPMLGSVTAATIGPCVEVAGARPNKLNEPLALR